MEEIDQFDILREVDSICAGNATVAISQLLGSKIELYMPSIDVLAAEAVIERVGGKGRIVIGVHVKIITGIVGELSLVFPEKDAFKLIDIFIKEVKEKPGVLTETGLSLIKEFAHIIISTYLGALSLLIKRLIIPTIPTLTSGPLEEVLSLVLKRNLDEEYLILTEAIFKEPIRNIQGCFYHIFPKSSAELILKIMREQVL